MAEKKTNRSGSEPKSSLQDDLDLDLPERYYHSSFDDVDDVIAASNMGYEIDDDGDPVYDD